MQKFPGFNKGTEIVPTQFFEELLPNIRDDAELRVTIFAFYLLNQFDGNFRYLIRSDFTEQAPFMKMLSQDPDEAEEILSRALGLAVERGTFLSVDYDDKVLYFINSPKGRTALARLEEGSWTPDAFLHLGGNTNVFRPTIFRLYEENIGPLTPMIADILRDAEKDYEYEWIAEAMEEAVVNNARSWRYIEAILKNRKENGRNGTY